MSKPAYSARQLRIARNTIRAYARRQREQHRDQAHERKLYAHACVVLAVHRLGGGQ